MRATRAHGPRAALAAAASLGLVVALTLPALAGEEDWATVTGYAPGSAENNDAETWGDNCGKVPTPGGGWDMTYQLPALAEGMVYDLVVVKAGSDQSTEEGANTLFDDPAAGQTVWADAVADGALGEGDKQISHIILCTDEAPEATPTPTPTPTPTEDEEPSEATPTPTPNEDTQGGNPTPTPGTLPDTAAGSFGQIPAMALSILMLAALIATFGVRMARQR